MVHILNATSSLGQIAIAGTNSVTGSIYITYLLLLIVFLAFLLMFKVEMKWIAVMILPVIIVLSIEESMFMVFGAVILIFGAITVVNFYKIIFAE